MQVQSQDDYDASLLPPHSLRDEHAVVAGVLMRPSRMRELRGLPGTAFYGATTRAVWYALASLDRRGVLDNIAWQVVYETVARELVALGTCDALRDIVEGGHGR